MLSAIPSQHEAGSSLQFKSKRIETDSVTGLPLVISSDTIDNPVLKQLYWEQDITEENIFLEMKSESNRLYSFSSRWPLTEIKAESLAEAGFFYLQQEDRVQCPFCYVIIYNWTRGDKPLREHMRKSPKCPFLLGLDVGNIPKLLVTPQKFCLIPVPESKHSSHTVTASYKPKHPRMADIKRRILTFSGWPLSKPRADQLAECGLYYSGISDVVTCFFCGGTLGNWEPEDDPWNEHSKFFPDCSFLAVCKSRHPGSASNLMIPQKKSEDLKADLPNGLPSTDISSDIIEQALDIFPEDLVRDSVKKKGGIISSLQELCDDILEIKQLSYPETSQVVPVETNSSSENGSSSHDTLLCKLCMDRERGVVFQPCGHLVSCWKCSNLISDCPVCRRPIVHKIRTYLS